MELPLNRIQLGDCLDLLKELPADSIDAVVSDPPYGLGNKDPDPMDIFMYVLGATLDTGGDFMGKNWEIPSVAVWREVYRVLKPGGYVASFGGTRTFDLVSIGLRMAGFECRDTISREFPDVELPILQWLQSQGMPKSHSISIAIDKKLGLKREVVGSRPIAYPDTPSGYSSFSSNSTARKGGIWNESTGEAHHGRPVTAPASEEAAAWEGWGSALKPSWEPILLFRKPFKGTLADNVLEHGTGGINIDATRVRHSSKADFEAHKAQVDSIKERGGSRDKSWKNSSDLSGANEVKEGGRWPSNVLLEHGAGCKRLGTKKIKGITGTAAGKMKGKVEGSVAYGLTTKEGDSRWKGSSEAGKQTGYVDAEGLEEIEAWECEEGCPARALNEQSGDRPSTLTGRADPGSSHKHPGTEMNPNSAFLGERTHLSRVYADGGGAARFFTQFEGEGEESKGRWPANVILEHAAGCVLKGTIKMKAPKGGAGILWSHIRDGKKAEAVPSKSQLGDVDGNEMVEVWECIEGCPVKALDLQSGVTVSGGNVKDTAPSLPTKDIYGKFAGRTAFTSFADEGGASRFFTQFEGESPQGRWPSNVVLQHAEDCKNVGTKKVKGITGGTKPPIRKRSIYTEAGGYNTQGAEQTPVKGYSELDGSEEVDAWECVEGCPVKVLGAQGAEAGHHPNGGVAENKGGVERGTDTAGFQFKPGTRRTDEGEVSRFFAQFDGVPFKYVPKANRKEAGCGEFEVQHVTVKPLSLIRWIVKLVTRKEGVVLDMYCGSGTTCHAAVLEGMHFIGMERDEASHAEATRRLEIVLQRAQEEKDAEALFEFSMGRS